ncbi:MAG: hypothetical protein LBQ62_00645 [Candidatus Accumulibacter sp.]|nr:hypothetical protein [Accumulibacter sp.]
MNEPKTIEAKIERLYAIKALLDEDRHWPEPWHFDWLCDCFDDLVSEIKEAGGVIPDDLFD